MTEMTPADIRFITERIEQRLRSMAEHEAAIRADLHALATLTVPAAEPIIKRLGDWVIGRFTLSPNNGASRK